MFNNLAQPALLGVTCHSCQRSLNDEEMFRPYRDEAGVLCDNCYAELCSQCEELVNKEELESNPGELIAVWSEAQCRTGYLRPGYYRVIGWPFFNCGLMEGHFYEKQLYFVTDLNNDGKRAAENQMYDSSAICKTCRDKVMDK